jgi:hypothetical protein
MATDDNIDNLSGSRRMTGGFAGLNMIVCPEKLYVYGRYDFMKTNQTTGLAGLDDQSSGIDVGIHYHLQPNVLLVGTFSTMSETLPTSIDRKVNTLSAGVLFGF